MARRLAKGKLPVPCIESKGFYPFESRIDVCSVLSPVAGLKPSMLDCVLNPHTMLPSGRWLVKFEEKDAFESARKSLQVSFPPVFRIHFRSIFDETKLLELQTTSKFGIDSKTVLAYDISPNVDAEELHYTLEDFALDPKGIKKIAADRSCVSFLIHFDSRTEAERAVFQLNGSSFAGSNLHLHLYC